MSDILCETTADMIALDARLETLQFQIYAYKKSKEMDHEPLMNFNLSAIRTLCADIVFKIEAEERRTKIE